MLCAIQRHFTWHLSEEYVEVTDTEKKIGPPQAKKEHGQKFCGKRENNNSKGLEERLSGCSKET